MLNYLDEPKDGLRYIEEAVKHIKSQVNHWLLYALILAKNKENKKSIETFLKAIDMGIDDPSRLLTNICNREDLEELRKDKEWFQVVAKLESLTTE